jgi:hypothetical protein
MDADSLIEIRDRQGRLLQSYRGGSLRDANLANAYLRGAQLVGADFRNANLRDADLREADLEGADFRGADLDGTRFDCAYLERANFSGMELPARVSFQRTVLYYADFSQSKLPNSDFTYALLGRANFTNAELAACQFEFARFSEANMTGAQLLHCKMGLADLCNTDFSLAGKISNTEFGYGATFDRTTKWPAWSTLTWQACGRGGTFGPGYWVLISPTLIFLARPLYVAFAVAVLTFAWLTARFVYLNHFRDDGKSFTAEYLQYSKAGSDFAAKVESDRAAKTVAQ